MKNIEKQEARRLRSEEGKSIKTIAKLVGVSVASVSGWVKNIELTEDQKLSLGNSRIKSRDTQIKTWIQKRKFFQEEGRIIAKKLISDHKFVSGCVIFWTEGSKSRCTTCVVNSDPEILKLFINFLFQYFQVKNEDVSIACRYYTDLVKLGEPERYWLNQLNLPESCLRKSCVNYYPKSCFVKKKKSGKLRYGVCRLVVNDYSITHKIYGAIQEIAGIEKEEWSK